MIQYQHYTREQLEARLEYLDRLPSKKELEEEIQLQKRLRAEDRRRMEPILLGMATGNTGDTLMNGYMFLLEENKQLHFELERCRDLVEDFKKLSTVSPKKRPKT